MKSSLVNYEDHAAALTMIEQLTSERDDARRRLVECLAESDDYVVSPDGGEAEELRLGIEQLIVAHAYDGVSAGQLQELLDKVDARDSLATLTELYRLRARVDELERELDHYADENEVNALRARIAELEAPPVVPEGWEVRVDGDWALFGSRVLKAPAAAVRALAWAIEHDARPPHAGDKP